jgi:hypothetical protein
LAVVLIVALIVASLGEMPVLSSISGSPSSTDSSRFDQFYGDHTGTWDGDHDDDDDDDDDDDGSDDPKWQLFGTAQRVMFLGNDVIRVDTFPAATFGGASIALGVPIGALDRKIAFNMYLVNIDCFGGSPRITLRVDLNGDGTAEGSAWGYVGPFATFSGCAQQVWRYLDMTDGGQRWDTSQLTGATPSIICGSFVCTFAQIMSFLTANFPNHKVLSGFIVQDAFTAIMQGIAFYDDLQIGDAVLD